MPRELNPELFGPRRTTASARPAGAAVISGGASPTVTGASMPQLHTPLHAPLQAALAEYEMADQYRKRIRELENQVVLLKQSLEKTTAHFEQRLNQVIQAQKNSETQVKEAFNEVYRNQAAVTSKLTERRVADAKIQEMIDRHNQLVQQFEARMAQMHKVASEQEMKIMTYQATIDEILREIRNLKR